MLEPDLDGDGTRELVWFYHGTDECYYLYPVDGTLYQAELTAMLRQARPEWASVAIRNDGCSPGDGQLTFTYEADGASHTGALTVQEGMLYVSASAG